MAKTDMWRSCVGVVLKRIKRHCWFIKMIKSTNISQVTLKVTAFIQKLTTSFTWLAINQFWPYHAKKRSPSLFLTIWCRNMLLKEEKPRKAILHYKILTLYPIKRKREKKHSAPSWNGLYDIIRSMVIHNGRVKCYLIYLIIFSIYDIKNIDCYTARRYWILLLWSHPVKMEMKEKNHNKNFLLMGLASGEPDPYFRPTI